MKTRETRWLLALVAVLGISFGANLSGAYGAPLYPTYPKYTKSVTLTWWAWIPQVEKNELIKRFTTRYPSVKIVDPQVGSGSVEYTKLATAIKAGSGAPDVAMVEFQEIPRFVAMNALLNIAKYADYVKPYYTPWTWQQVSQGSALYACPEDAEPMVWFYRTDLLRGYGLSIPKTWSQFANEAAQFHTDAPGKYFSTFPLGAQMVALWWQAGARPFKKTAKGWEISLNSPKAKKITNYWGALLKKGYIKWSIGFSPAWQNDIAKGAYAALLGAPWYPNYVFRPFGKPGTNNWDAATPPQWSANGTPANGNFGGSTAAVTVQTKHPRAAAIFASWLWTNPLGLQLLMKGGFASDKYGVELPAYKQVIPPLVNKQPDAVYNAAANEVDPSFEWSPWTDFVYGQMTAEFAKAHEGQESWNQALDNIQKNTVAFARASGYNVVEPAVNTGRIGNHSSSHSGVIVFVIVVLVLAGGVYLIRRSRSRA